MFRWSTYYLTRLVMLWVIIAIIGRFTKKQLNPRYEDIIDKKMDKVTLLTIIYFGASLIFFILADILTYLTNEKYLLIALTNNKYLLISYTIVGVVVVSIQVFCGYRISLLKGNSKGLSILWGIFSITSLGLLILLLCTSYHPIGELPPFPIYRGKKLSIKCISCGHNLRDYECNIGTEGICPKCKTPQRVWPTPRNLIQSS